MDFSSSGAVGGDGQVDAPAAHLAGQAVVVAGGVEAEEREAEAVLAPGRAVATAGVAAGLHEDRHHVEPEAERRRLGRVRHRRPGPSTSWPPKATARVVSPSATGEKRAPRGGRARVGRGDGRLVGHVAGDAVGVGRLHDDRLAVARRSQVDVGREDLDLHRQGAGAGAGAGAARSGARRPRSAPRPGPARGRGSRGDGAGAGAGRGGAGQARGPRPAPARVPGPGRGPGRRSRGVPRGRSRHGRRGSRCSHRSGPQFLGAAAALAFSWLLQPQLLQPAQRLRRGGGRRRRAAAAATGMAAARRPGRWAWEGWARRSAACPPPRLWTIGSPSCVTTTWQNRFRGCRRARSGRS